MDVMKIRIALALGALAGAIPLAALAAPTSTAVQNEGTVEARLTAAMRALPAQQRSTMRARMRVAVAAPSDERPVTGALRPNTFRAMRARMVRPRDTATADASIPLRYVRKLDAICQTMPAATRRDAGMTDDACTKIRARAVAAPK
jgi:hypothetical protein